MRTAVRYCEEPAGNGELLRALIETRGELVHFLSRRLRCRATAEDIAQDVYLRLSASSAPVIHPRSFIFRAAANLASNHQRDEKRRAEIRDEDYAAERATAEERDPERVVIARDALRRLATEISTWPERTRELFILNRYDDYSWREIGERLGLSSTTIERHMAKAVLKLAAWADKNCGYGSDTRS